MTLSDPEVIKFLSNDVIPVWESVGSVPKVTIELGDGRTLKRTLGGNIVTYLLSPHGHVYDAFPGVYTPQDYLTEIRKTLQFFKEFKTESEAEEVLNWHRTQLKTSVQSEEKRMTLSKAMVESPLLKALRRNGSYKKGSSIHQSENSESIFETYASRLEDISKQEATVDQLRSVLLKNESPNDPEEIGLVSIGFDSRNNLRLLRPAVHLYFSQFETLPEIHEVRDAVFTKILHIPLNDPYLGLADAIVPGTK